MAVSVSGNGVAVLSRGADGGVTAVGGVVDGRILGDSGQHDLTKFYSYEEFLLAVNMFETF